MSEGTKIDEALQGEAFETNGGENSTNERVDKLSTQAQDRFFAIVGIYGDGAFDVLDYYKNKRAKDQWGDFLARSKNANDPENVELGYLEEISSKIELDKQYSKLSIVQTIQKIRVGLGMESYNEKVFPSCFDDLCKVFLVEVTDDKVYIPVFHLMVN